MYILILSIIVSYLRSQNITRTTAQTHTQFSTEYMTTKSYILHTSDTTDKQTISQTNGIREGTKFGIMTIVLILFFVWIGMVCGYFYKKRIQSKQSKENNKVIEMNKMDDEKESENELLAINRIIEILGCDFKDAHYAYYHKNKNEQSAINYLLQLEAIEVQQVNDTNKENDTMTDNMVNVFSI